MKFGDAFVQSTYTPARITAVFLVPSIAPSICRTIESLQLFSIPGAATNVTFLPTVILLSEASCTTNAAVIQLSSQVRLFQRQSRRILPYRSQLLPSDLMPQNLLHLRHRPSTWKPFLLWLADFSKACPCIEIAKGAPVPAPVVRDPCPTIHEFLFAAANCNELGTEHSAYYFSKAVVRTCTHSDVGKFHGQISFSELFHFNERQDNRTHLICHWF